MTPYFYKFDQQLFTNNLISEIDSFVLNRLDEFIAYESDHEKDGNNYYYSKDLKEISEIKSLIKKCSLECFPMIVLHKPNSEVIKHKDDPHKRNTVIITPIHPASGYTSTYFWDNIHDENPVTTCDFTKGVSTLFNTQKIHRLINNTNEYRFNLQICFDENFDTVLNLYQNNILFKE
jgi:hypothetical protein